MVWQLERVSKLVIIWWCTGRRREKITERRLIPSERMRKRQS